MSLNIYLPSPYYYISTVLILFILLHVRPHRGAGSTRTRERRGSRLQFATGVLILYKGVRLQFATVVLILCMCHHTTMCPHATIYSRELASETDASVHSLTAVHLIRENQRARIQEYNRALVAQVLSH